MAEDCQLKEARSVMFMNGRMMTSRHAKPRADVWDDSNSYASHHLNGHRSDDSIASSLCPKCMICKYSGGEVLVSRYRYGSAIPKLGTGIPNLRGSNTYSMNAHKQFMS
jgi:hypothetical protein